MSSEATLEKMVDQIEAQLEAEIDPATADSSPIRRGGSLLLLVGLPGSGKSSIVDHLAHHLPFVVISTDAIRLHMQASTLYTAAAMERVYDVCYALIVRRLNNGQRVVFDASNYLAARREHVTQLAESCGATVATATIQAAQETIRQRLLRRMGRQRREGDLSDADWSVYKWMVEAQEPVVGPHLILDTTSTAPDILAQQLAHYWLQVEERAPGNLDLQSPRWASQFSRDD
jgi:predicted kinase